MSETELVKDRYERRKRNGIYESKSFVSFVVSEREKIYSKILKSHFAETKNLKMLEIGAGTGSNLSYFLNKGILADNMYANELLNDRLNELKKNFPDVNLISGDATQIVQVSDFDLIFQSTVFTSILDNSFKQKLALKMWQLLKPGGIILWYDFTYNNPNNSDVKGIKTDEIKKLFPLGKEVKFYKVTLAPPIGRRAGNLYPLFNVFRFLRTHVIAVIKK